MTSELSHPLWLAQDVYVCDAAGVTIALDLREGRYLSIDDSADQASGLRVAGWPRRSPSMHAAERADLHSNCLANLIRRGLLTVDASSGKAATPVQLDTARAAAPEDSPLARPRIHWSCLSSFLRAVTISSFLLRHRTLRQIVIRARNRRSALAPHPLAVGSLNATRERVVAFESLRPFFFTARDRCLFYSLALLEFLALEGATADWVFGVRSRPFAAHCWLQQRSLVLNDVPEHVACFTPIMVV